VVCLKQEVLESGVETLDLGLAVVESVLDELLRQRLRVQVLAYKIQYNTQRQLEFMVDGQHIQYTAVVCIHSGWPG